MIYLTKMNGKEFVVNAGLIETVEANPDTTITTTTGKKIIIKESVVEVINKTIEYKQTIYQNFVK